jgi:hypothetical protein
MLLRVMPNPSFRGEFSQASVSASEQMRRLKATRAARVPLMLM